MGTYTAAVSNPINAIKGSENVGADYLSRV